MVISPSLWVDIQLSCSTPLFIPHSKPTLEALRHCYGIFCLLELLYSLHTPVDFDFWRGCECLSIKDCTKDQTHTVVEPGVIALPTHDV